MNSTVEPIFNESFVKKEVCESREQCTRPTGKQTTAIGCFSKKKKKKKKKGKRKTLDAGKFISTQTGTKSLFGIRLFC